jgi:hypothetical protein
MNMQKNLSGIPGFEPHQSVSVSADEDENPASA